MQIENSERLKFRLLTEKDAELLFELDQDSEVMRHISGGKKTTWQEMEDFYIPRLNAYTVPEKGWGLWKVTIVDSNEFIGWVLVRPMNFFKDDLDLTKLAFEKNPKEEVEFDNLEIGWRFIKDAWGKGYATEAATAIINELITDKTIKKISAVAMQDNIGSINIMKKLGMSFIKNENYQHQDKKSQMVYYSKSVSL